MRGIINDAVTSRCFKCNSSASQSMVSINSTPDIYQRRALAFLPPRGVTHINHIPIRIMLKSSVPSIRSCNGDSVGSPVRKIHFFRLINIRLLGLGSSYI